MKKIIFLMITVVLLVACTKSIDNIQPDDPGSQDLSNTSDFRYQPEMNSTENSIIPKPTAEIFQEKAWDCWTIIIRYWFPLSMI